MENEDCFALFQRIKRELVGPEDRFAYAPMDHREVPIKLLDLSLFADLFGIDDDDVSSEFVKALPIPCLEFFCSEVRSREDELEKWLVSESAKAGQPSLEFLKYTMMSMAYDYANMIIDRSKNRE